MDLRSTSSNRYREKNNSPRLERGQTQSPSGYPQPPPSLYSRRAQFSDRKWTSTLNSGSMNYQGPSGDHKRFPATASSMPLPKMSGQNENGEHELGAFSNGSLTHPKSAGLTSSYSLPNERDGSLKGSMTRLSNTIKSVNFVSYLANKIGEPQMIEIDGEEVEIEQVSCDYNLQYCPN